MMTGDSEAKKEDGPVSHRRLKSRTIATALQMMVCVEPVNVVSLKRKSTPKLRRKRGQSVYELNSVNDIID